MNTGVPRLVDFAEAARSLLPALEQLEGLLEGEIQALTDGDPDTLVAQVQRKRALLRELETRMATLQVPGPKPPGQAPLWQAMLSRLTRCHSLNEAIGATVIRQLRDNDQLLRLLGYSPDPVAYGPRSSAASATGQGRRLGLG